MSGVSKVYQSVSNAMCRKRSNHKGLRAFRPGFDSPRSHSEFSEMLIKSVFQSFFCPFLPLTYILEKYTILTEVLYSVLEY